MKTLVVEDDLKSQCLLAKVLAERGHDVTTFENAEQAILAYQQEFYPMVFVDAGLPGMDGLQFCRWIRSQPKGDRVFLMMATEPQLPKDVSQVLESGANDFLSKPYELNALRARLSIAEQQMERFFEQQQLEQALQDETGRWTQVESDMAELRESYETQLRACDEELMALRQRLELETETRRGLEQCREEWDGRIQQMELSLHRAQASAQEALSRQEQLQTELEQATKESSTRRAFDPADLTLAQEALRVEREQREQLAAALGEVQQEHSRRTRELEEQLARCNSAVEEERAQREHVAMELVEVRQRLAAQVGSQTAELLALSEQLKNYLEDRKRLDAELNQTREDLVRRVRDQVAEVLRLSDELKAANGQRHRLEEELAQQRQVHAAESHRSQLELQEATRKLNAEEQERLRFQASTEEARRQLELALAERRAAEALLEETAQNGQKQQIQSQEAIERLQQEEEDRRQRLSLELEQTRSALDAQQADLTRATEVIASKNDTLRQLEEVAVTHREARKRVESCWRAVTRLGAEVNAAETPEEVARSLAVHAQELLGWEIFSLDAYEEAGDWIHPILNLEKSNGHGAEASPFHPGPQPTSLMRRVLEDGPQLVLRPAPSCSNTDLVVFGDRARRSASLLYVPVKAGHRVVAFLSLRSVTLEAYDGDDIEILMTLASIGGGALLRLISSGQSGTNPVSAGVVLPTAMRREDPRHQQSSVDAPAPRCGA
jgi:DNA-binding response OmpR family regulator